MEETPSPAEVIAEVTEAARRIGMTKRTTADVAAMAIIRADETVSLGEARRIVAKALPKASVESQPVAPLRRIE